MTTHPIDTSPEAVAARANVLRGMGSTPDARFDADLLDAMAAKLAEAEKKLIGYRDRLFPTTVERDQARDGRDAALAQFAEARRENEGLRKQIADEREHAGDDDTFW